MAFTIVLKEVSVLFDTIKTMFMLYQVGGDTLEIIKLIGVAILAMTICLIIRPKRPEMEPS